MTGPNFPIIDLHCHFEGSIHPQKSYEILHRIGYAPAQNREEFFQHVTRYKPGREGFFDAVSLLNTCLIDQASIIDVTADIITRAAQQNVKILEMSFAPRTFKLRKPQEGDLRRFMEALLTGVGTGVHNQGIAVGLTMLILPRHFRQESIEACGDIHDIIREYRQHISGVDICSLDPISEEQFSEAHLQKICETVRASGLHLSAHAGEFFDTKPVEKAISLGVERIGHGIRTIDNQEILERVKEHNITLEVCPISNYRTGALGENEKHPLRQLLRAGVRVTINSDDQGVQNSTWGDDYTFAIETIGLTDDEIRTCLKYSFEASFLASERKNPYRELFIKNGAKR